MIQGLPMKIQEKIEVITKGKDCSLEIIYKTNCIVIRKLMYLNGGNYQSTLNILNHFASNTGVGNFLKNIRWKKIFKNSITRKILQFLLAVF
jgi:hypothetical protein